MRALARDRIEDGAEHRRRQPSRIGVVATAMIAIEQYDAVRQRVPRPVGKAPFRGRFVTGSKHGVVRKTAECKHHGAGG